MGRPQAPTPIIYCLACGKLIERQRKNGKLESIHHFRRRRYCDPQCAATGLHRQGVPQDAVSPLGSEEWLREAYARGGSPSIARELGVSKPTVLAALARHGIVRRPATRVRDLPSAEVVQRYLGGESASALGQAYGVSHHRIIHTIRTSGAPVRDKSAALRLARSGRWSKATPILTREYLEREYVRDERSIQDIAQDLHCSPRLVSARLRECEISLKEPGWRMRGRRRPTGVRALSQRARRDHLGTRCAWCESTEELELHHLDGDRSNDAPANLCTLCYACHRRVEWFLSKALGKAWDRVSICEDCPKRRNGPVNISP